MTTKTKTNTKTNFLNSSMIPSGSTIMGLLLGSAVLLIASCGSTGSSRPAVIPQSQPSASSVASMQSEIDDLKRQLEDVRQEILEVRAMSEEARAAADIAQTQAAATDDRIDQMFKRAVFK